MTDYSTLDSPGWATLDLEPELHQELIRACEQFDLTPQLEGWTAQSADRRAWRASARFQQTVITLANTYLARWPLDGKAHAGSAEVAWGPCWINRLSPGQSTPRHTHDCLVSWTAWPWSASDLIFDWTSSTGWPQSHSIAARAGQLCLFPARLAHRVELVQCTRWSISGNILLNN